MPAARQRSMSRWHLEETTWTPNNSMIQYSTERKTMEPEKIGGCLEKEIPSWKPSISGFMLVFGGVHSCHSPRLDWVDSSLYHKEAVVICTGFLYGNMWEKVGARKNISLYNGQTQIFGTS